MYQNFGSILHDIRLSKGMTQDEFAALLGTTKQVISRYETGQRTPKITVAQEYANKLNLPLSVLLDGNYAIEIPPGFQPTPPLDRVPRVGRIACGQPITAEENIDGYDEVPSAWHSDFTLLCEGESMLPRIQDGDIVAIHKQPTVENGEIAAVRVGTEATLKRVFVFPDHIELRAENPEYPTIIRIGEEMNDVVIEGKAVGLCRKI